MDTREAAANVRTALKAEGYNAKRVSVRTRYYSMGSSIDVTIRDATANTATVNRIAEGAERIDRCEITGDILSGGNRFVHVTHTTEARAELAARWSHAVAHAMVSADETRKNSPNSLHAVTGFADALVGIGRNGWGYALWLGGTMGREFDTCETGGLELALHAADQVEAAPEPDAPTIPPTRPVCPNCEQWADGGDCVNECAKRGFAPKPVAFGDFRPHGKPGYDAAPEHVYAGPESTGTEKPAPLADFIGIQRAPGDVSTLQVSPDTLTVLGNLPHGASIAPRNVAEARALQAWLTQWIDARE